ncbi:hypothetical protein ALI144C_52045 [Actinosynnema sp. ALI-1.44]|uniref:hypothetical protein n=1 Tax=Actinosynnema sp. ALI-1.44 TaxID=1933779 RepID=UPI00097BC6DF|nr:hypothetical protein [Actinosynnema sp. ALI-1.44]ONI71084.1 hypothetical protein ALI144C_52045 [Actinosynnema sp. ALI-1.44]
MALDPESVDWHSIPGVPQFYRPEVIAPGLRRLAGATGMVAAAGAASSLDGGGLVHGHSAGTMPAAATAAPILLAIVEHGHPTAKEGACRLLEESMQFDPYGGYTRVSVSFGAAVPICCAVAHHVHAHRDVLLSLGQGGRSLIAEADTHWLFEVGELIDDGVDTIAFGTMRGRFPRGPNDAECHSTGGHSQLGAVCLEYPVVPGTSEACLRLSDVEPRSLPARAVLLSGECGRRVH